MVKGKINFKKCQGAGARGKAALQKGVSIGGETTNIQKPGFGHTLKKLSDLAHIWYSS